MLTFVTGPSGSGKSLRAEELALAAGAVPLYVATLPRCDWSLPRIDEHARRRGNVWSVHEVDAPWAQTRTALDTLFAAQTGVLIDGLASLLWMQAMRHSAGHAALERVAADLRGLLCAHARGRHFVVVDCPVPFPRLGCDFWFNALMHGVHTRLIEPMASRVERMGEGIQQGASP